MEIPIGHEGRSYGERWRNVQNSNSQIRLLKHRFESAPLFLDSEHTSGNMRPTKVTSIEVANGKWSFDLFKSEHWLTSSLEVNCRKNTQNDEYFRNGADVTPENH